MCCRSTPVSDTAAVGIIFSRPEATPHVLTVAPVLESWERTDHPDQQRLRDYLDQLEVLVGASFPITDGHLALELTVGLPTRAAARLTRRGRADRAWIDRRHNRRPVGYTIDTVIPIIGVQQASYRGPDGSRHPWAMARVVTTWVATGLGWALVTLLVVGCTGLVGQD
jgi:hypothetical protein